MYATLSLFGQTTGTVTERFEFGQIAQMTPLYWLLLGVVALALMAVVIYFYIRDCVELGGLLATVLIALRLGAFLGLLWIFLDPKWRIERPVTVNSKVLMLFDTSLSMAVADEGNTRRIDEVVKGLSDSELIRELRRKHDLMVMRFDSAEDNVVTLVKIPELQSAAAAAEKKKDSRSLYDRFWPALVIGGVVVVLLIAVWLTMSLSVQVRAICSIPIVLIGAVAVLIWSANFTDLWSTTHVETTDNSAKLAELRKKELARKVEWKDLLAIEAARGRETRLVEALTRVVDDNLTTPAIAGIVVVTDGRNTDGINPANMLKKAKGRNLPIYTVGVGSDKVLAEVRLTDLSVPIKAYPGDSFVVRGLVQGSGLGSQTVDIEITSTDADNPTGPPKPEGKEVISLDPSGAKVPFKISIKPEGAGRRKITVKVTPPGGITNPADQIKSDIVEIVDQKTQVLLFASGPTREYRFLRNQLRRDESMIVDVLLQTIKSKDAISQDANEVLLDFPKEKIELRKYHAIVCFDPDWKKLSPEQIDLLENWVGKDAGGLIVIPGKIHTDEWVIHSQSDEALKKLRILYPVIFRSEIEFGDERGAKEPRRIDWMNNANKKGDPPSFLQLTDSPSATAGWRDFEGFYDCYETEGVKKGAHLFARLAKPNTPLAEASPVLMAEQFYGPGRVFYLGSGEMWRIRALEKGEDFFEAFYTKLIRRVSQGTLLRGTKRGMLLTEDAYDVGETVFVRVTMEDAQGNELVAPSIVLEYISPDEQLHTLTLKGNTKKPGYFIGQFPVTQKGTYRLVVNIPDSDGEKLTKDIKATLPDRENRNTRLNRPLLAEISGETGAGKPLLGMAEATNTTGALSLVARIKDRTEIVPVENDPQELWDKKWIVFRGTIFETTMSLLTLYIVVALLCLEWIIRRLCKLA